MVHWEDVCSAYLVMGQLRSLRWIITTCEHSLHDFSITPSDTISLYMVPGAPAPLMKICIGGDNLLLLYADDRARMWDVKTLEFWRSMDTKKAKELLGQGSWTELSVALCTVRRAHSYFREQVASRFAVNGKRTNHALGLFA
jgi:hypothetical protein